MYDGTISGVGPRYCPSIETKIVRFADKPRHQLFIEPCGLDTEEMYIQGFSSSLPEDVQVEMLHTIPGLEGAEMTRPATAYGTALGLDTTGLLLALLVTQIVAFPSSTAKRTTVDSETSTVLPRRLAVMNAALS